MKYLLAALLLAQWVGPVPDPPLTAGSLACYNLDEASNVTRVDSCGSSDLTDMNSDTPAITGVNNNGMAPATPAVGACLTNATAIPLGLEFTVNLWVDNLGDNASALVNGQLAYQGATSLEFGVDNFFRFNGFAGGNTCNPFVNGSGTPGFNMVTLWLHPSDGKLHCAANNGPEVVANIPIGMQPITGSLIVGSSSCSFGFGAGTDEVSFWDRALSFAARQELLTTFAPY